MLYREIFEYFFKKMKINYSIYHLICYIVSTNLATVMTKYLPDFLILMNEGMCRRQRKLFDTEFVLRSTNECGHLMTVLHLRAQ